MGERESLKPCPFCGNREALDLEDFYEGSVLDSTDIAVVCNFHKGGCGASSSYQRSEAEAIAAWNRRAELPATPVREEEG